MGMVCRGLTADFTKGTWSLSLPWSLGLKKVVLVHRYWWEHSPGNQTQASSFEPNVIMLC